MSSTAVVVTKTSTGQVVDTGKNVFTRSRCQCLRLPPGPRPDGRYVQSWLNRDIYAVVNPPRNIYNVVTQDLRNEVRRRRYSRGNAFHPRWLPHHLQRRERDDDPGVDYFHLRSG